MRKNPVYTAPIFLKILINALAQFEQEKDLVIVIGKKNPPSHDFISLIEGNNNIKNLKVSIPDIQESKLWSYSSSSERTCTLIFKEFSNKDIDLLLQASQDESFCTGDLPPFEHMSYYKHFVYELKPHKEQASKAMIYLAKSCSSKFHSLLSKAWFSSIEPQENQPVHLTNLQEGILSFFQRMKTETTLRTNLLIRCLLNMNS